MKSCPKALTRLAAALAAAFSFHSCAPKVFSAESILHQPASTPIKWPKRETVKLPRLSLTNAASLKVKELVHHSSGGPIFTYGAEQNGREDLAVYARRTRPWDAKRGTLSSTFFPTSSLAGPSPYSEKWNTLKSPSGGELKFLSTGLRTTIFELHPCTQVEATGTLLYQTSVMFLSLPERHFVRALTRKGWNVVVAYPCDNLYRTDFPGWIRSPETIDEAAGFLAQDIDQYYAEQAAAVETIYRYLNETRPTWLQGHQAAIGLSAGSFTLPAVALKNPDRFEKLVFINPGANLLTTFHHNAADILQQKLDWLDQYRRDHPQHNDFIPTNKDLKKIYQLAAKRTHLHAAALAPRLQGRPILFISGRFDRILPKSEIETTYSALGRPERWSYPLGHQLVTVNLLTQVNRLHRWLTAVTISHRSAD